MKKYFPNGSDGTLVAKEIFLVDGENEAVGVIRVVDSKIEIINFEEVVEEKAEKPAKKEKKPVAAAAQDGGTPPTAGG